MPIIRKKLVASAVYPDDLRYNSDTDTVQSFVNGSWVDNPQADPRTQTTLPPRLTSDPQCDAAQSVVDAIKGQIDDILTAIDNAQTAFTIASLVLGLFTFGVFDIFIAIALTIANYMLDAGTTALSAALTPTVYQAFLCIIYCRMDSQGRIDDTGLTNAESDITDQIGGVAAVVLNSFLALAGSGGVSNLASLGTSTGDCADCGSGHCTDLLDHVYLGTIISVTDTEIIMASEYNPGPFGTDRVAIGSTFANVCCKIVAVTKTSGGSVSPVVKLIHCGTVPVDEDSYTHGYPSSPIEVNTVALDDTSPFEVTFTFAKVC